MQKRYSSFKMVILVNIFRIFQRSEIHFWLITHLHFFNQLLSNVKDLL
jgi:hypothetical protein